MSGRRWLDRNEDDGQIVRELVPFADGQRLYSERWLETPVVAEVTVGCVFVYDLLVCLFV